MRATEHSLGLTVDGRYTYALKYYNIDMTNDVRACYERVCVCVVHRSYGFCSFSFLHFHIY